MRHLINWGILEVIRFTRLMFGLNRSPFTLKGILKQHWTAKINLKVIEKIQNDMYVDDLVSRGTTVDEVENLEQKSIEKWHSNLLSLESTSDNSEATYVK